MILRLERREDYTAAESNGLLKIRAGGNVVNAVRRTIAANEHQRGQTRQHVILVSC